ncbi:MAG: DNA repair and recombination protein RadA [Nanoarchaeota archaeon]|nr:DNA repair and recombination protein RadA [Nanoarchaeota archaeon]
MSKKEFKISDLPGVGAATAEKLREAGYDTLMAIAVSSPGEMCEITSVSESTAKRIINVARSNLDMGFESGEDLLKKRGQILKLTTGCKLFDEMLAGGFETGGISEAFGEFGSSKSQIAHILAVRTQLSLENGGADGSVIFVDGESTFRPERIQQISDALGLDSLEVLKNIKVARAFNSDHQMLIAEKAEDVVKEGINGKPVRLIVVDSLTSHFRADFSGRGQLADRQQKLNRHMHVLMKLANQYNLCVYVTNQVMSRPDQFFGDPTAAIGGNIVGHNCVTPDTLIQISDGLIKPISELYEYNNIISYNLKNNLENANKKIGTIVVRNYKGKLYNLRTNHKIKCSGKHRFFKINNFQVEEVRTENLREGDYIAHSFNLDINGEKQELPKYEITKLVKLNKEGSKLLKKEIIEKKLTRKNVCENTNVTPRQLRRVLNQEYPTNFNNFVELTRNGFSKQILQYAEQITTNKYKEFNLPETLDNNFAQILGYFLGDGNFEERSLRFRDARYDVLETYNNLFEEVFRLKGNINKVSGKNCFNLDINNKTIRDFTKDIMKNVFDYVAKSPKECVASFIKGFFDAEGSIDKKYPKISASQKDETVLRYMQLFLDRLGIRSSIRGYVHNGNQIFHLDIKSLKDVLNYGIKISVSAKDKKEVLTKWIKYCGKSYTQEMTAIKREDVWNLIKDFGIHPSKVMKSRPESYKYIGERELNNVIKTLVNKKPKNNEARTKLNFLINLVNSEIKFEKINKISTEDYDGMLYDFSVLETENYIANGFCSHNSQTRIYLRKGKKGSRVAKLIDSPHLPDSECAYMVTEKGLEDLK